MNERIKCRLKINQKGLTLVELLISLAIFSLVLVLGFQMFFHNLTIFSRGESRSEVQYDVRMASDEIRRELRNADDVRFENLMGHPNEIGASSLSAKYSSVDSVIFEIVKVDSSYFLEYICNRYQ